MAGAWYRGRWPGVVAGLLFAAGCLTGSPAGRPAAPAQLRVLQLNLCNSGIAGCYTGRSVAEAARVIRASVPAVVMLNEVCEDDVPVLGAALRAVARGGTIVRAFQAAGDRRTAGPTRCRNGQPYGIGLLASVRAPHRGRLAGGGLYPDQDRRDPEERAWLCLRAPAQFLACTTHLASASRPVALAQCHYLLGTVVPRTREGREPAVVGGDLNLRIGGSPDVRSCLPPGYLSGHDGASQHVAADGFAAITGRPIGMDGTTDHPALLVALTPRRTAAASR
jgi:hypothetical protein